MVKEKEQVAESIGQEETSTRSAERGKVTVVSGVHTLETRTAGLTVGDVRGKVEQALNIDPSAIALVNGEEIGKGYVLQENDQLEFVRQSGEKG